MTTTAEELLHQDVRVEFAKSRSYFRVARALGIPMEKVKAILGEDTPPIQRRQALFGGRGRPEMEKYIIATTHVDQPWNNKDPEIAKGRFDYEAGTHEMMTGRDGDTLILYLIPRVKIDPRPNYFSGGYVA